MSSQTSTMLTAADGTRISATHVPGDPRLAFVLAHGFTGRHRSDKVARVLRELAPAGIVAIDMRGHGDSEGVTTIGYKEIEDVSAAVTWARELGYAHVVTIGFSLGGAVVIRQAAIEAQAEPDAVVSVSAPAFWYYKGTRIMRLMHRLVDMRSGRQLFRLRRTRIDASGWPDPMPMQPVEAAEQITDIPVLIVHGDVDHYFPLEHPRALHAALVRGGNPDADLWELHGFAHAESSIPTETIIEITAWVREHLGIGDS